MEHSMRVLIVDDHAFVCEGLKATLEGRYQSIEVNTTDHGDVALTMLVREPYDLAIVDLFMPGAAGGFSFVEMLCESYPKLPLIVLSASENITHIRKCLDFGVSGFVTKSAPKQELFDAIEKVLGGGRYVPDLVRESVPDVAKVFDDLDIGMDMETIAEQLTSRQMQILELVARGQSNKQIARNLELAENTVKVHVSAILRALGLKNRTQAGIFGQRLGMGTVNQDL